MTKHSFLLSILLIFSLVTATACGGDDDADGSANNETENSNTQNTNNTNNDETPTEVEAFDAANAMGVGGHSLLPWPADQYMRVTDDALELVPDAGLLPAGITPGLIDGSGASRTTPIVTWLPGGFDPATLPDPDDWGATLEDDSPVRVVVLDNGESELWPVLAEIDATADPEDATLILRPHRPFPAGSQVAVGLRTSLQNYGCHDSNATEECQSHKPNSALQRIIDGEPDGDAEKSWMSRGRDALLEVLPLLGPDASDLAQAWTFTVRGHSEVVDPLIAMQEIAAEADASSFELEPVQYEEDRALVYGELDVPWFLDEEDRLVLDQNGEPQVQEVRSTPFLVTIPKTVTEPRPIVLFGHGFFSSIEESTWSNLFDGLEQWQMPAVTTTFHGFSEDDYGKATQALSADTLEGMQGIIDLQRQSQANFTVVYNMLEDHLSDSLTINHGDGDLSPLDGNNIPYMGISNGGTQGLVMMSTSPVLERGALVVPGGGWSHMLQRASQWQQLGFIVASRFDNDAELQLGMAMLQQVFDPVDSLNYVEHLIEDRLPGLPETPELLMIEAINDAQVANMVTRWVAGAANIPIIVPSVADVWGIPTVDASLPDGAPNGIGYELYDLGVPDNPPGNIAATENGVHDDIRLLDAYREQMGIFLEDGRVVRTCDGPCDPE